MRENKELLQHLHFVPVSITCRVRERERSEKGKIAHAKDRFGREVSR